MMREQLASETMESLLMDVVLARKHTRKQWVNRPGFTRHL